MGAGEFIFSCSCSCSGLVGSRYVRDLFVTEHGSGYAMSCLRLASPVSTAMAMRTTAALRALPGFYVRNTSYLIFSPFDFQYPGYNPQRYYISEKISKIGVIILGYRDTVPLWEKSNLTLEEAAAYSGIGINKLRTLSDKEDCSFVLWVGNKRLLKRKKLDEYLDGAYSI